MEALLILCGDVEKQELRSWLLKGQIVNRTPCRTQRPARSSLHEAQLPDKPLCQRWGQHWEPRWAALGMATLPLENTTLGIARIYQISVSKHHLLMLLWPDERAVITSLGNMEIMTPSFRSLLNPLCMSTAPPTLSPLGWILMSFSSYPRHLQFLLSITMIPAVGLV